MAAIKAELNLHHWLERLIARQARAALPVVVARAAPLVFGPWKPDRKMAQGSGNEPVAAEGPHIMLAPLVGWDGAGYRLWCGDSGFDRRLAALTAHRLVNSGSLAAPLIPTLMPQPHQIAMDKIVAEFTVQASTRVSGVEALMRQRYLPSAQSVNVSPPRARIC